MLIIQLDEITTSSFENIAESKNEDKSVSNYTVELTDESGNKLIYDSKTKKLSATLVTENETNPDNIGDDNS